MANSQPGLLAKKVGMTQIFTDKDTVIAVTVLDLSGNSVVALKNEEGKDGYNAVQLGFGTRKENNTTKPMKGHFEKSGVAPKQHLREVRLEKESLAKYTQGSELSVGDFFSEGDKVDISGTSKGRGFAGVMKRYNFAGFITSHGTHEFFRHGGSIGTRLTPGHVLKGKKMPGHMGAERVTVQNLSIVKVDAERNILYIKGGVPGANGGLLLVRKAVK